MSWWGARRPSAAAAQGAPGFARRAGLRAKARQAKPARPDAAGLRTWSKTFLSSCLRRRLITLIFTIGGSRCTQPFPEEESFWFDLFRPIADDSSSLLLVGLRRGTHTLFGENRFYEDSP
jgi:hypothetical protein